MLHEFVSRQPWWDDEMAQLLFEIDLLCQPYLYTNFTPEKPNIAFSHIEWIDVTPQGYLVGLPVPRLDAIRQALGANAIFQGSRVEVNHRRSQTMPFSEGNAVDYYGYYCLDSMLMPGHLTPVWQDCV